MKWFSVLVTAVLGHRVEAHGQTAIDPHCASHRRHPHGSQTVCGAAVPTAVVFDWRIAIPNPQPWLHHRFPTATGNPSGCAESHTFYTQGWGVAKPRWHKGSVTKWHWAKGMLAFLSRHRNCGKLERAAAPKSQSVWVLKGKVFVVMADGWW